MFFLLDCLIVTEGAMVNIAASADRSTESTKLLSTDLLCFVVSIFHGGLSITGKRNRSPPLKIGIFTTE